MIFLFSPEKSLPLELLLVLLQRSELYVFSEATFLPVQVLLNLLHVLLSLILWVVIQLHNDVLE
jgi:hypothetical protein